MMPCLNKKSLKLMVGTADERYDYSPEYFRKTHFPQVMHRYHDNQLIAEVTECELFEELQDIDSIGNRVYLVFGSTGSGKSELLCWLKDKWTLEIENRPVIRISRNELNPQILIKKCLDVLNIPLKVNLDEKRWDLLLRKPITLINQIVWTALAESMESDEEIVPVALLLRPIIEKNVVEFTTQIKRGRIKKPLEVLHREQFDAVLNSTTLSISLEYLPLRQTLSRKLDQFLFEGWDIASLFQILSNELKIRKVRPLLLIDDLVQSVNIYATDLLDQLITLEEGNWDVVIGLTPGAVQDSDKGFDLLRRVQNLDTIHDRVKKLWLSDESGKYFYNLGRNQVIPYMANYLEQLKGTQGFVCSPNCNHYYDCSDLVQIPKGHDVESQDVDIKLLPFNRHMLKRTFDAIPLGSGKLRYMILHSKEIIRFFLSGNRERVSRVIPLVMREKFADHEDLLIKTLAEWYVPERKDEIIINQRVMKHFGYVAQETTTVRLKNLGVSLTEQPSYLESENIDITKTEERTIIRDWIEGRVVNMELLAPVRLGVAALVHDAVKGINMSRPFTPRTASTIQRFVTINRTRYPIVLGGNTKEQGIQVEKGYAATQIINFQMIKHSDKERIFRKISNECETASWVYQAEMLQLRWLKRLEQLLDMKPSAFVHGLKNWVTTCEKYSKSLWAVQIRQYSPFNQELVNLTEQCYQDWFMLRENLFQPCDHSCMKDEFERWLIKIVPSRELEHYQIGNISMYVFLSQLKESYQRYRDLLGESIRESIQHQMQMVPYLLCTEDEVCIQYATKIRHFNEKMVFTHKDFVSYTLLEQEMESHDLTAKFNANKSLYQAVEQLINKYHVLGMEVMSLLSECSDQVDNKIGVETIVSDLDNVRSNLGEAQAKYLVLIDELTRLRNCLTVLPRSAIRYFIQEKTVSSDVAYIQSLWMKLVEFAIDLMHKQPVGLDLFQLITELQSIDFYKLRNHISNIIKKEHTKAYLIEILRQDLNCNELGNADQLLAKLDELKELRPAIKRQVRLLIEKGDSRIPSAQWKNLLNELKDKLPHLFKAIEIRLVVHHEK